MIKTIPHINQKALMQVRLNKSNAKQLPGKFETDAILSKRIKSITEFPDYVIDKLKTITQVLKKKYPVVEKIYLTGSYAYGLWVDEKRPEEINRKRIKKGRPSDFDVILFPHPKKFEIIDSEVGKIDIMFDSGSRRYKLLIWEKT